jgi:hypothetical protein
VCLIGSNSSIDFITQENSVWKIQKELLAAKCRFSLPLQQFGARTVEGRMTGPQSAPIEELYDARQPKTVP